MRIVDFRARQVEYPLSGDFYPSWGPGIKQETLPMTVVEVELANGVIGYGVMPTMRNEGIVGINTYVKNDLIGLDVFETEKISRILARASLRMIWPWGIELGVWDAIGKLAEQPVYKLWGGANSKLKVYASLGEMSSVERSVADAKRIRGEGFSGVKLRFHSSDVAEDLLVARRVIEAVGPDLQVMVDANQADSLPGSADLRSWDYETALRVGRELEALGVYWLEEPLARFDLEGLRRLSTELAMPIAGGEKNQMKHEFKVLIENSCYDIIQADAIFSDGIFQLRKIAAFAEIHNKRFVPHTWGNCISLFGNLQLAASVPNCDWFEYPYNLPGWDHRVNNYLFKNSLEIKDGYVFVPDLPGLGFEMDLEVLEKCTVAQG